MVKKWLMGLKTLKGYKDTYLPEALVNDPLVEPER